MTRLERLREAVEEPLLVSNLVNVRYLTGLDELERGAARRARARSALHRLPLRRARAGGRRRRARRHRRDMLRRRSPALVAARVEFEADCAHLRAVRAARGRRDRARRRRAGSSRRCGRSRTRPSSTRSAARPRSRTRRSSASPRSGSSGAPSASSRGECEKLLHEAGADGARLRADRRRRADGRVAARGARRPDDRGGGDASSSTRAARVGGYCSDCTRTFLTGELPRRARAGLRRRACEAQQAGLAAVRAGRDRRGRRRARAT